ncbi:hypothetical protein PoB_003528400 [Plakobranchus ocellatus]|uniref:Uncharacterized protein n=1 Tax=Plakobranchus ocellatus TaxID=259542 RepID=A0AAV4AM02_9GAST|nr:hypothetical protein PoB_003528400 [Plakobranchus ocellatus]
MGRSNSNREPEMDRPLQITERVCYPSWNNSSLPEETHRKEEEAEKERKSEIERERENESKRGRVKKGGEAIRQTDRQADRQTDREKERAHDTRVSLICSSIHQRLQPWKTLR